MSRALSQASNVLIVCLDNIGDLIWAGALATHLKEADSTRSVGLWCKQYTAEVAAFMPNVDRVHACDPFWESSPGRPDGTFSQFKQVVSEIRTVSYDAAMVVNTRWKVCAAVRWTGIPERVGFSQRLSGPWLTRQLTPEDRSREVLDEWTRLLGPFCTVEKRLFSSLRVPKTLEARQREIESAFTGTRIAVLHPSAGSAQRCAPVSFWRKLAAGLEDAGFHIGWIGRSDELDKIRDAVGGSGERHQWVDRLGSGSLTDSLLMTASAALFVGHDSGPLHAAAALEIPCIGLYLPGDWPRARATGNAGIRVFRRNSPQDIDAAEVLAGARKITLAQESPA